MIILPAIDLYDKKAVRLLKGDYNQMTVYDPIPLNTAKKFLSCGASFIHLVDLEGAKTGLTPNIGVIQEIINETGLNVEVGGGIRNIETVSRYLNAGVKRVILGTAAVTDPKLLELAVSMYGDKIAVGCDIKDGYVAIKGWTESSSYTLNSFVDKMQDTGVKTMIITDISRDGMMQGTNKELYKRLSNETSINIIASGGVSSIDDIIALKDMGLYGAIIGKAYYTGAIDLKEAINKAL